MVKPDSKLYRYTVLLMACLMIFGNYFVYDLPGALSNIIMAQITDPFHPDEEVMTQTTLNLLYSVYNFPNIALALLGGIFVDRLGLRLGGFVFCSVIFCGQVIVALGGTFKNYWIILVGRAMFAIGGESASVAQNVFVSRWFRGKELALALGLALSLGRLGSGLNFLTSAKIAESFGADGLTIALWFGVILCGVSELAVIFLCWLDKHAEKTMGEEFLDDTEGEPEQISLRAVRDFPAEFWIICFIVICFYSGVFPFNAMAVGLLSSKGSKFVHADGSPLYDSETAGYIVSIPSFLAVFLAPLLGQLVDYVGRRPMLVGIASLLMSASHVLFALAYTHWDVLTSWQQILLHPVVCIVIFGFAYGLLAAALFPCVPLCITQLSFVGTAFGLIFSMQNGALALVTFLMGVVKDNWGFVAVEVCFAGFGAAAACLAFTLYILDRRRGGVLSSIVKGDDDGGDLESEDGDHKELLGALLADDVDRERPRVRHTIGESIQDRGSFGAPRGRRSRCSYDYADGMPTPGEMLLSRNRNRNQYLNAVGIIGMEGRMRGGNM